jgi:muramoyltetrapeptide carboxypeptidase
MESPKQNQIMLISPSSPESEVDWESRLRSLQTAGITLSYHKLEADPSWPFHASTVAKRLDQLMEALKAPNVGFVWAVRGGYGASDLLDLIPWDTLRKAKPKVIVGFSDISALHSAFFTKLGWAGIHGPMPATPYWGNGTSSDILSLEKLLLGEPSSISIPVLYLGRGFAPELSGWSFGGCFSVLTNLIGTPYFPDSLEGSLLFWEDIGEHPSRILRMLNQWVQSGCLRGVRGIVLGRFVDCFKEGYSTEASLCEEIARRLHIPVWHSPYFGHCTPNWPLPIGKNLRISTQTLSWEWDQKDGI